ncbi:MAG TPA: hypothetical protein VIZ22_03690 [Candidatus Limnocylindrales bacterium]
MSDAKVGDEFVTHEYDEAIAIQRSIVDAEQSLSTKHPVASAKRELKSALADDRAFLEQLEKLGKPHGATGKVEDVAEGLTELMTETLETAVTEGADSDFYEAHAVLVSLKRKQADGAGGMLAIARDRDDTELRKASQAMQRAQISSSNTLSEELAMYAVKIASAAS